MKEELEKSRVFFVVHSFRRNAEIFEYLEDAEEFYNNIESKDGREIYVAIVNNYYYDEDLKGWNYEDFSNTFSHIKTLREEDETENELSEADCCW